MRIKKIKGLDKFYITENGLVYRIDYQGDLIECRRQVIESGYARIGLVSRGVQKDYLVHRLVASAFIKNEDNLPIVNHKDCDKLNNDYRNLEWCTHKHNMQHASRSGLLSGDKKNKWKRKFILVEAQKMLDDGMSINEISKIYGVTAETIRKKGAKYSKRGTLIRKVGIDNIRYIIKLRNDGFYYNKISKLTGVPLHQVCDILKIGLYN
jgi:hypothetical protein